MAAALRKQSAMDAVAELALNNGWDYCLTEAAQFVRTAFAVF
jgi:hypothetical protein